MLKLKRLIDDTWYIGNEYTFWEEVKKIRKEALSESDDLHNKQQIEREQIFKEWADLVVQQIREDQRKQNIDDDAESDDEYLRDCIKEASDNLSFEQKNVCIKDVYCCSNPECYYEDNEPDRKIECECSYKPRFNSLSSAICDYCAENREDLDEDVYDDNPSPDVIQSVLPRVKQLLKNGQT